MFLPETGVYIARVDGIEADDGDVRIWTPCDEIDKVEVESDGGEYEPVCAYEYDAGAIRFPCDGKVSSVRIRGRMCNVSMDERVKIFVPKRRSPQCMYVVSEFVVMLKSGGARVGICADSSPSITRTNSYTHMTWSAVPLYTWVIFSNYEVGGDAPIGLDALRPAGEVAHVTSCTVYGMEEWIPCEVLISPHSRYIFFGTKTCDDTEELTYRKISNWYKTSIMTKWLKRAKSESEIVSWYGVVAECSRELGISSSHPWLGDGARIEHAVIVQAYPYLRAFAKQPKFADSIRWIWLHDASVFVRGSDTSWLQHLDMIFERDVDTIVWQRIGIVTVQAVLGLEQYGKIILEFVLKEYRQNCRVPSMTALATLGKICGNGYQFPENGIPSVVSYDLHSKCIAVNKPIRNLVMKIDGYSGDRTFPVYVQELFQPLNIITIGKNNVHRWDRGSTRRCCEILISLKDTKVANKCGRAPNHKNTKRTAWGSSVFNFAHMIRLAMEYSKRRFWSIQPPLAVRSLIIDPMYESLMVPYILDIAPVCLLEILDAWRFTQTSATNPNLVIATVRSLCRVNRLMGKNDGKKHTGSKYSVRVVYIYATLCAVMICPPKDHDVLLTTIVRSIIVSEIPIKYIAVALQVLCAEYRERLLGDESRYEFMHMVIDRLSKENRSCLLDKICEFLVELFQTIEFSNDLTCFERLLGCMRTHGMDVSHLRRYSESIDYIKRMRV